MANVFDDVSNRIKGSPFVLWVCLLCVAMFSVGLIHFAEDLISSRNGIALLEKAFSIKPVNLPFAYWTLSVSPQIGQTVFFYMFLIDRQKNRWALALAIAFFLVDFVADLEDRTNQHFLPVGGGINLDTTTLVGGTLTIMAFTIGSELFLSVSTGLFLALFRDAIKQFGILYAGVANELADAKVQIYAARRKVNNSLPPKQNAQQQQGKGGGSLGTPVRPQHAPNNNGHGGQTSHQTPHNGGQRHDRNGNGRSVDPAQHGRPPGDRNRPATPEELDALFNGEGWQ